MAKSILREFVEGYEQSDENNGESRGKKFFCRSFSGTVTPAMLHSSKHGILKIFNTVSKRIQYMSTKALGAAMLAFGIVTVILSFLADYGSATGEAATISFIIGVAMSLVAIPLLLSDGTFAYIFQNSKILDKILFDFLCINKVPRNDNVKSVHIALTAVIGALLGLLGYFIPVWWVIFTVLVAVFVYLAFGSPEFSFFSTFFLLPYISHIPYGQFVLVSLVLLSVVSFTRKVLTGKRVYSFEQYDAAVLFIAILILVSGVFAKGNNGVVTACVSASATLGYFISSNVITNRRLADCMLVAITLSSVAPAVISFCEAISVISGDGIGALLSAGVSSVFPDTVAYAVFILVTLACTMALIGQSDGFTKMLYILAILINIGALVACAEPFALLAFVIGLAVYIVLNLRKSWSGSATFMLVTLPYAVLLIITLVNPETLSLGALTKLGGESLGAVLYHIVSGIGTGADSFAAALGDAAQGYGSPGNIFISIGLSFGIFALAAFIIILVIRVKHRTMYHGYIKHSEISMISPVIAVATVSVIVLGTARGVFDSLSSYYLFWCVFGAGSATLRVAKKEYDEREMYFEDAIDSESSVADVKIV